MSSQKQTEANRLNALKSTGPTSAAGKAASSMNALKTGMHAKSLIIKGEKAEDLQALIDEYYARYQPATPDQRGILDDLINIEWQLRRLTRAEAQMWNHQMEDSWDKAKYPTGKVASNNYKSHAAMQRRLDSTRRARTRAIEALRELVANPLPLPSPQPEPAPAPITLAKPITSPQNGFVPAAAPSTPAIPAPAPSKFSDSPVEPAHIPHI